MKMKYTLAMAIMAVGMSLVTGNLLAQPNGGPGGGRPGRGNFDPAQRQQDRLNQLKTDLEIKDDAEWNELQPRIKKVMDAEQQVVGDRMRGMFRRNRGGDNNQPGDQGGSRRGGMFGTPSPEYEALQKAIEAKAPKAEIKAAMEKFVASRKAKQAEMEKAQDELRKVLTSRQEAILTLNGVL